MRAVRSAALAAALPFAACAAPVANSDADTEVRAFLAHYVGTLEARDETAVRALFVDDGRFAWFTDGARSYASPHDVLAGLRRYQGMRFRTELSAIHVMPLSPTLVAADSRFRTHLTIPGSEPVDYGGVITWLLERTTGDQWRVLRGHTSTPGGPPAARDG